MGGIGSGRRPDYCRDTVDSNRSLDVNLMYREGCLEPGRSGSWQWSRNGERVAWIGFRADTDRILLSYRWRWRGGEWQDVEEPVRILRVPCRFGGTRPYFLCPGVVNGVPCGRRVVKLYGAGRYFLCRHCYRLPYASQGESDWDRAIRRADRARQRLGGGSRGDGIPPRPKGMWRSTYDRLRWRLMKAEIEADEAFIDEGQRLLDRIHGVEWRTRAGR